MSVQYSIFSKLLDADDMQNIFKYLRKFVCVNHALVQTIRAKPLRILKNVYHCSK